MEACETVQQRHTQLPHSNDEQLPCVLAVDDGNDGHDDAQPDTNGRKCEVKFAVRDFVERP